MPELGEEDMEIDPEDAGLIENGDVDATRTGNVKIRLPPLNRGKKLNGPAKRVRLDTPEAVQKAVGKVLKTLFMSTSGCTDLASANVFLSGCKTLLADMRRAQELELVSKVEALEERLRLVVGKHG